MCSTSTASRTSGIGLDGTGPTLHLRAGTYSLAALIATPSADGLVESYAFLGDPEITLTQEHHHHVRRPHGRRSESDDPAAEPSAGRQPDLRPD